MSAMVTYCDCGDYCAWCRPDMCDPLAIALKRAVDESHQYIDTAIVQALMRGDRDGAAVWNARKEALQRLGGVWSTY